MNAENLRPPSTEEARERGRKGGIASGKARKERKSARVFVEAVLDAEIVDEDGEEITVKGAMVKRITRKAMEGDLSAVKYLFELIGESPAKSLEIANRVSRFRVVVRDG